MLEIETVKCSIFKVTEVSAVKIPSKTQFELCIHLYPVAESL